MKKLIIISAILLIILAFIFFPIIRRSIADGHIKQGNEYNDNENFEQALLSYQKALSVIPDYKDAEESIIYLYMHQGDVNRNNRNYEEAANFYQKGLDIDPYNTQIRNNFAYAYYLQGKEYHDMDNYEEAIIYYKKAIDTGSSYHSKFMEYYDNAIKGMAEIILFQGNLLQENKLYNEVIIHYKEAIVYLEKLNNDLAKNSLREINFQLGNIYLLYNNFEEAIQSYKKALNVKNILFINTDEKIQSINKNLADAYIRQGQENILNNNYENAAKCYQNAYKIIDINNIQELKNIWNEFALKYTKNLPDIFYGSWEYNSPPNTTNIILDFGYKIKITFTGNKYKKEHLNLFGIRRSLPPLNFDGSSNQPINESPQDNFFYDGKNVYFLDGTILEINDNYIIDITNNNRYNKTYESNATTSEIRNFFDLRGN